MATPLPHPLRMTRSRARLVDRPLDDRSRATHPLGVMPTESAGGHSGAGGGWDPWDTRTDEARARAAAVSDDRIDQGLSPTESRLIEETRQDICEAFPWLPAERVSVVVQCLWAEYDDAPIRDFIPLLVAKQAREELRDQFHAEATDTVVNAAFMPSTRT